MFCCISFLHAQTVSKSISQLEEQYRECIHIRTDSTSCSKLFLAQMDSMLLIVLNKVKEQVPINEKSSLLQDQLSWSKKKADFYKVQEETFKANIADGSWKKDMIRISYQQKAEFLLKRIKVLLKKLKE